MTGVTGSAGVPPVWLGAGAVTDPRALARFGPLLDVPLVAGPVEAGSRRTRVGRTVVHGLGVGGLDHEDARSVRASAVEDVMAWAAARGLTVCVALRGRTTGDLAAVLDRLRRHADADVLQAVEVDLRAADEQEVLRSMSRVREASPRGQHLLARLSVAGPDLVGRARSAVAGGATAVVLAAQVPLAPGRWWSGPSTAALGLSGLRQLVEAAREQRWPGAPLVIAGGIHSEESARVAVREGAAAVQLGTGLWADPTLLWRVRDAVLEELSAPTATPARAGRAPHTRTTRREP
ncbi:hypothetical protein [Ornithinimicrobium tianjinense]|uniref:hypothetical protein n=1 Tax=Ornithinimicrobium tianjinense TaxID=1195761 RepID=UPI001663342E|nr:hypothetical protein [Ornithinimicrobium tianjinense]